MPFPNPFRGVENPRAVWAWGMYDLANQSFQLFVNTLLFGIFLATVVVGDAATGRARWGLMVVAANLLVVVASPIMGAIADSRSWKREILLGSGFVCVALMAGFSLLAPGMVALAAALYVAAAFCCGIGENFLGSFLPELARKEEMGRVSAIGWSMSYAGALLLLGVAWVFVVTLGYEEPARWRSLFLLAAGWFGAGMLPAVFFLHEKDRAPRSSDGAGEGVVRAGFAQLRSGLREAGRFRQLARFLGIFFVYSMGTQSVVFFAGLIGDSFGFGIRQLILMALVMAVTAGAGAVATGVYQDRVGHRRTVMAWLTVWVVSTLGLALMRFFPAPDLRWFWLIAGGLGLGLGGIGTASRALVGAFTPEARSGQFFGLWGMVYKLAAVGALAFGVASSRLPGGWGLLLITAFFAAGLALMPLVNETEGVRAAKEAEAAGL